MLTIKNVSKMTNLSEHTLRAWEKRYGAIIPDRSIGGRRSYTIEEVNRLKILANLTLNGLKISQLAQLKNSELESLNIEFEKSFLKKQKINNSESKQLLENKNSNPVLVFQDSINFILIQLKDYNIKDILNSIQRARWQSDIKEFLLNFISPLLNQVGLAVENGKIDISHEHCLSAILKYYLSDLIFQISNSSIPRPEYIETNKISSFIFATPEGDLHEFGIQISACLASLKGYDVFFLGCNMPEKALQACSKSLKAKVVVLGCMANSKMPPLKLFDYIKKCKKNLNPRTQLWVGGNLNLAYPRETAIFLSDNENKKIKFISNFNEFDSTLNLL